MAKSEKQHKQRSHRAFRALERQALARGAEDMPQKLTEAVNPWSGDKDGKQWFGDLKDHQYKAKLLRK